MSQFILGPTRMAVELSPEDVKRMWKHMATCCICRACPSCATSNCIMLNLIIESRLPKGDKDDPTSRT